MGDHSHDCRPGVRPTVLRDPHGKPVNIHADQLEVAPDGEWRILTISPEGKISTLIEDPRLIWVDAMWIDDAAYLLILAAQLNECDAYFEL